MKRVYEMLRAAGLPFRELGVTAIDSYLGLSMKRPVSFILVEGSVIDLAKTFAELEYPSLPYADASLSRESAGEDVRFVCTESIHAPLAGNDGFADFRRDPADGRYHDPRGVYPLLKRREYAPPPRGENSLFSTAILLSRFSGDNAACIEAVASGSDRPSALMQRDLLSMMLQAPHSGRALEFLSACGFVQREWPELHDLQLVDHAKECHPEGGGWSHTMEALGQRKERDLTLSLAILLHDIGKPKSETREGRKFDGHAEIGSRLAGRFLARLGYEKELIADVQFLIRWHMLPAALPRLPLSRVDEVVLDPRFPALLELFRCDEFSSFKGPDQYYAACASYRTIMKHVKNPYRENDGRKRNQIRSNAPA